MTTSHMTTPSKEPECDLTHPKIMDSWDCEKFYECVDGPEGPYRKEKRCGPGTWFNHVTSTCEWPQSVLPVRPDCPRCPPGKIWNECAVPCGKMCQYYDHTARANGKCITHYSCLSGCRGVDEEIDCSAEKLWRDEVTCVAVADCTCISRNGTSVKPGIPFWESECEVCQCMNNEYSCDNSLCTKTTTPPPVMTMKETPKSTVQGSNHISTTTPSPKGTSIFVTPSSTTPPILCDEENLIHLIDGPKPLPPSALTASTFLSPVFSPQAGRLGNKTNPSEYSWTSQYSDKQQYLQVDLGREEPVYGAIVQGSPLTNEYVSSYKVLHSLDGQTFSYITGKHNKSEVFRGPINSKQPVRQMFYNPVEARYIRFVPETWNQAISMKVELIGCSKERPLTTATRGFRKLSTTPIIVTVPPSSATTRKPEMVHTTPLTTLEPDTCIDPMGVVDGNLPDSQITVSSVFHDDVTRYGPGEARLNNVPDEEHEGAWIPATSTANEWIQFDFFEPRNLTSIITQGLSSGNRWVEAYKVFYSHDSQSWNPIVNQDGSERVFPANFDGESERTNHFKNIIQAQYLRVVPVQWHNGIAMRLEILGCFLPYPTVSSTPPSITTFTEPTVLPRTCHICPTLPRESVDVSKCNCTNHQKWDGHKCVPKVECPCFVHKNTYKTGTMFFSENCQQCMCALDGYIKCESRIPCDHCGDELQSVVTPSCACVCKPCPPKTKLCPTSNICVSTSLWCNGIEDCPDDERNCTTPSPPEATPFSHKTTPRAVTPALPAATPPPTETTASVPTTLKPTLCPSVSCPPGYTVKVVHSTKTKKNSSKYSRKEAYSSMGIKGVNKLKGGSKVPPPINTPRQEYSIKCTCIPNNCTDPPTCPQGMYAVESGTESSAYDSHCNYACKPNDAVCKIKGRTIMTFDSTEYQYDYCNHILARDTEHKNWGILVSKKCSTSGSCTVFIIVVHDMHELILYTDQRVNIDGYNYNADEVPDMEYQDYAIHKSGDTLFLKSYTYPFSVTIDSQANVNIEVEGSLFGHVDGLCGFFDGVTENDKRRQDGSIAHTTKEFGNSWAYNNISEDCKTESCPVEMKETAHRLCSIVREKPLSLCKDKVNVDQFIAHCIESTCSCLKSGNKEEDCKCKALTNFVTDCLRADDRIDLSSWRVKHDCPSSCPAGLVHYECYRRHCESNCWNRQEEDPCPITSKCFSGCFCPEGLVRFKYKCVPSSNCRDCECAGLGNSQYTNFDRTRFSLNGNCTYVAARDVHVNGSHDFEVLVTNGECKHDQKSTCTRAVTILFEEHIISITVSDTNIMLEAEVDGNTVANYPFFKDWLFMDGSQEQQLSVVISKIQLELSFFLENFEFMLRLPSHLYGGKTEGLCGNCNHNPSDDFKTSTGKLTDDIDEFGMSWLSPELSHNEECKIKPTPPCHPLPSEEDVCQNLLDRARFGECHAIVNPDLYYETCKSVVCNSTEPVKVACHVFEAYARECLREGVCLSWRSKHICPYQCKEGFEYRCGSGCTETCDNYELYRNDPSKCQLSEVEGCFCQAGKVLHNGMCVEESHCKPCDEYGHYSGDKWNPDACTLCSCNGSMVQCKKTNCPLVDRMCDPPSVPTVIANASDTQCCPDYSCRPPVVNQSCPEVQKPECKDDQVLELTTKADNCSVYVCRCKTKKQCHQDHMSETEMPQDEAPLGPGMERVLDTSGCCEQIKTVCNTSKCPTPLQCPKFYQLKEFPAPKSRCCSAYTCEPPSDVCLYEYQYIAGTKGGERKRSQNEKFTVEKSPGSIWQDGPCRECNCAGSEPGEYRPVCTITPCLKLADEPDAVDYVLEHVPVHGSCCPQVVRVACKDGNDVYQAGSTWPSSSGDRCQTVTCQSTSDGSVQKVTIVRSCVETCDLGFLYKPSPPESDVCCGQCKQVACVKNGKLYEKDSIWYSPDHCTKYSCHSTNGSFQTLSVTEICSGIAQEILVNYVVERVSVPGECCERIKKTQCKQGDTVYKIGESWPSPNEKCKSFKCIASGPDNQALIEETRQTCLEDCDKGWQYQPPDASSGKCCGKCVPVACDVNGTLYKDGDSWKVNCTTYSCKKMGDQLQIIRQIPCSDVVNCPSGKLYSDGCCWKCNMTRGDTHNCNPKSLALENTVKLVKYHSKQHGLCVNEGPVKNFAECDGNCRSSTSYNSRTNHHDSNCNCCQPIKVEKISVDLTCERGGFILAGYNVSVPTVCGCQICSGSIKEESGSSTHSPTDLDTDYYDTDFEASIPNVVN